MGITIILVCVVAVSGVNTLLLWDLYNRDAAIIRHIAAAHHMVMTLKFELEQASKEQS